MKIFNLSIFISVLIAGCGGGGGSESSTTNRKSSEVDKSSDHDISRFSPEYYDSFISENEVDDFSGTWILLANGVTKNTEKFYFRAIRRIGKPQVDPNNSEEQIYFTYSCGPGGARSSSSLVTPTHGSIWLPLLYESTTTWTNGIFEKIDEQTLFASRVSKNFAGVYFDFQVTVKKISDDPYEQVGSLIISETGQEIEIGCVTEYQKVLKESPDVGNENVVYSAQAFPMPNLIGAVGSYSSILYYSSAYALEGIPRGRILNKDESSDRNWLDYSYDVGHEIDGTTSTYTIHLNSEEVVEDSIYYWRGYETFVLTF